MPLTWEEKGYPICDASIWIKVSKIDNLDLIYQNYKKVFIADAVSYELNNKKKDDPDEFGVALKNFRSELDNENVYVMHVSDSEIFSDREKRFVKKAFCEHGIPYDENKKQFTFRLKDLGEKVSAIYAAAHNLEVILVDDTDTDPFVSKFYPRIAVVNLIELLHRYGCSKNQMREWYEIANPEKSKIDKKTENYSVFRFKNNKDNKDNRLSSLKRKII